MDILSVVAGFGVGLMVGLTGIGGGALMTPILILFFGAAPTTALGTDLVFAVCTKSVGVALHGVQGSIDWQVFRRLCMGSLPAAAVTGVLLWVGRSTFKVDQIVLQALGCMLLLTAIGMLFKSQFHAFGRRFRLGSAQRFKHIQAPLTVLAGIMLGIVVTLTSVGAGAFGAVLLLYLYPLRLTPVKLVGTDLAHAIPVALIASLSHFAMGNINFSLLGQLLCGSIPGVLLGVWYSSRVSESLLRRFMAGILAISGIKIFAM